MSDGMSDMARESREADAAASYLRQLVKHLGNPSELSRKAIIALGLGLPNSWRYGYGNFRRDEWPRFMKKNLAKLEAGDKAAWSQLLRLALESSPASYRRLKKVSPFKNRLLLFIDYDGGSAEALLTGDVSRLLSGKATSEEVVDGVTYSRSPYLIAVRHKKTAIEAIKIPRNDR